MAEKRSETDHACTEGDQAEQQLARGNSLRLGGKAGPVSWTGDASRETRTTRGLRLRSGTWTAAVVALLMTVGVAVAGTGVAAAAGPEPVGTVTATTTVAHSPSIFAVRFISCRYLHVGYNYFPAGVGVHWRVNQTGTGTLASGSFVTLGGRRTYHFVTAPLGVTLAPDSVSSHTHVRFSWTIGTKSVAYEVTRDPGCVALRWKTPSTIRLGVVAHYASIDRCPAGTASVSLAFLFLPEGGTFPDPVAVRANGSWSANFAFGDVVPVFPVTVTAFCNGPTPHAPPLAVYETHPITITP
jgi:hypothetical protein